MRFIFYSSVNFEEWDFRTPDKRGIGGSETSHIEMSWRLARRGHEVISYAPIPKDCPKEHKGVKWFPLKKADFSQKGTWVIYRDPTVLDKFSPKHPNQKLWLLSQDEDYPTWNKERIAKLDRLLAFCTAHRRSLIRKHEGLEKKTYITSNGIKMDIIRKLDKKNIKRDPKRLIYSSSPDRGLFNLLKIFKKAREYVPDLSLYVFYGFNNMDKLIKLNKHFSAFAEIKENIKGLLKQPGVHWKGRIPQPKLYEEFMKSGIWCYPTNFTETSCITSMEAQALGAIPITNPLWALADNVRHGIFLQGNAEDPLMVCRYSVEITRLATQPELQKGIRYQMMQQARGDFNWERFVDQWESWILGYEDHKCDAQYNFQLKNVKGKILNIGCDIDIANLKELGATNVDILKVNPLGLKTRADIIADARDLPSSLHNKFDTVILGDILEHMKDEDIIKTLKNGKKCLRNGGNVIVTCPNDSRPVDIQHITKVWDKTYVDGISAFHERPISKEHLTDLIKKANMKIIKYEEIDYSHFLGHGILCN